MVPTVPYFEYRNATVLFSVLVSFGLPIMVQLPPNTCFLLLYPCFLLQNISSVCRRRFLREWGVGVGLHRWRRIVCGFAHKNIMVCDLMFQPRAQFQVPVRLLVPQGTGYLSSADHAWVWPSDRNYDSTFNKALHVQNGFIHFFCHKFTQIREYDQGLPL